MRTRTNIWFSVTPSDDENSDISGGSRQNWDQLLPLLLHRGLLKYYGGELIVVLDKWNEYAKRYDQNISFITILLRGRDVLGEATSVLVSAHLNHRMNK